MMPNFGGGLVKDFLKMMKYKKSYVSPYAKFDKIRKRKH